VRLNLTLDDAHAAKLNALAERTHVQAGTLARSMLLTVLDQVSEPQAASLVQVLDGIEGAFQRAELGSRQLSEGETVPLEEI
jgi:hypothetical protein